MSPATERLALSIAQPHNNQEIPLGVNFEVRGAVSGTGGLEPNPIESVTVQIDGGQRANAILVPSSRPRGATAYTATARLSSPGEHLLRVSATAERGSVTRTLKIATAGTPYCRAGVPWNNYPITQSLTPESTCTPTTLAGVVAAVREAEALNKRVHAFGSKWAFSDCAVTSDQALDTTQLYRELAIEQLELALRPGQNVRVYHVEAGVTIRGLYDNLYRKGLALETMGGASGQTLAGAISTGTHGGDKYLSPLADSVLAIHLVGVGGTQFWIEPSVGITDPARLREHVVRDVDPKNIIYDDAVFNACLVSLGCMGVIYAVVLRVRPAYDLVETTVQTTWQSFRQEASTFLTDPDNRFLQVLLSPYRDEENENLCMVTTRAEAEFTGPAQRPEGDIKAAVIRMLVTIGIREPGALFNLFVNGVFDGAGLSADQRMAKLVRGILTYAPDQRSALVENYGSILAAYWPSGTFQGSSESVMDNSYGKPIPLSQPGYSIEIFFQAIDDDGQLHFVEFVDAVISTVSAARHTFFTGYISLRFTGSTRAYLGMQQWKQTCGVELATVQGVQGLRALLTDIYYLALGHGGLPHWGQMLDLDPNVRGHGRLYRQYSRWREVYAAMSNNFTARTFENDLSARWRLTTKPIAAWQISVAPLSDGRLELWGTGTAGGLFTTWKVTTDPNAGWALWADFLAEVGGLPEGVAQVAVAPLSDGRLELWVTGTAGGLFTTWKATTDPNADWVPWEDFPVGAVSAAARQVAVAPLSDRRLELWVTDGAGGLFTTWKETTDPNAAWAPWVDFLAEVGGLQEGVAQVAVAPLSDGRLELWATGTAGGLFTTWKATTDPNADWAPWVDFLAEVGGLPEGVAQVAVAPLSDGRLELWVTGTAGGLFTTWKATTDPNADWVPWEDFPVGAVSAAARQVAVAPLSDRRLELWVTDGAGGLFTTWKETTDPNAAWAPWVDFLAEV
ncbi:FAD-binding protein [Bradyrhizobium sp. AZCC 1699]|uniref:FAD-binding protein n=1 Tax=Bradyrhizobium sp. AZCC 1699 TaxID=3117024 RepID=UPI002FF00D4B